MENQFDKAVREGLGKLQVKAPAGSWKAVEQRLERENRRRSLMIFIPWAASIALAFLIGMLFYDFPVALYSHHPRTIVTDSEDTLDELQIGTANVETDKSAYSESFEQEDKIAYSKGVEQEGKSAYSERFEQEGKVAYNEDSKQAAVRMESTLTAELADRGPHSMERLGPGSGIPVDAAAIQRVSVDGLRVARWPVVAEYQADEKPNTPASFELGGNAAPLYSFRNSSSNSQNDFFEQTGGLENQSREHGILSYSGGLDVSLTRSRWTFSSGVYLSRVGHEIDNVTISKVVFPNSQSTSLAATSVGNVLLNQARSPISVDDVNALNYAPPSDFQSVTTEEINASLQSSFSFVELPFTASYRLVSKPLEISLVSGVSLAILYKNQVQLSYQNNISSLAALSNLNTLNYNTMAGVELAFPISRSLKFHFQPLYRQSLSPLNKDFVVNYYLYSFSLLTGLSWSF